MIIDGEKWACDACVRGHRVSNCQHYGRPLQHINKKGRPVTQCQHCRSQRKNRSAHVKCDCGEKTTKCVHLGALKGHRESCCCNHGGACTCAMQRDLDTVPETSGSARDNTDNGDGSGSRSQPPSASPPPGSAPAPNASSSAPARGSGGGSGSNNNSGKSPVRRRRANTTRSEGTLPLEDHGRHKCLSQKHTRVISQKSRSSPAHRIHGARSSGNLPSLLLARRATDRADRTFDDLGDDDLSSGHGGSESGLDEDGTTSPLALDMAAGSTNGSVSTADTFYAGQFVSQQQLHQQQRRSRSETASPMLFANGFPQAHQPSDSSLNHMSPLSPLNLQMTQTGYANSYAAYGGVAAFSPDQADQPLVSAGLHTPSIDWSQLGLAMDRGLGGLEADSDGLPNSAEDPLAESLAFSSSSGNGLAGGNLQNDFSGSEQAPTMTTATSGDVSEAEDSILASGLDDYEYDYDFESGTTDGASSSVAFSRVNSGFHLSAAAASAVPAVLMARSGSGQDSMSDFGESPLHFIKSENFIKSEAEFLPPPQTAAGEELAVLAMADGGLSRLQTGHGLDDTDASPLWMADYSNLPTMTEAAEPDALFWAMK